MASKESFDRLLILIGILPVLAVLSLIWLVVCAVLICDWFTSFCSDVVPLG